MVKVHHLNCVEIQSPVGSRAIGHCLLLETKDNLVLVDIGIGLLDTQNPEERIGKEFIDVVGYHFDEKNTAIRQIENLGLDPRNVTDCIISHLDNDYIGGLPDFPQATVQVGIEELENLEVNPTALQKMKGQSPEVGCWAFFQLNDFLNFRGEMFALVLKSLLNDCGC